MKDQRKAKENIPYISKASVKMRGWSDAMIKRLLGSPDKLVTNPHYRSAPKMQLFAQSKVEALEQTDAFKQLKTKYELHKPAAKKAIETKTQNILAHIENVDVLLQYASPERIKQNAIRSYNDFHEMLEIERGHHFQRASETSDHAFLERIIDNYIRHELTNYEEILQQIKGKVGVSAAYDQLRKRIEAIIAKVVKKKKITVEEETTDPKNY